LIKPSDLLRTGLIPCYEEVEEKEDRGGDKGTKRDKIRFTFSLNPYNNLYGMGGYGGGMDIKKEIERGIEEYKMSDRLKRMEQELRELREGNSDDDEDEKPESTFAQVYNLIESIRKGDFKGAQVSGDIPNPDNDHEADTVIKKTKACSVRTERLKKSLQIIQKLDPDWLHIEKLAALATKQPVMFKNFMGTLMNMNI
jgi:hypothetical protein